ncbi:hypothetical protein THF5H11_70083 [Vibrio jasicida]|nr:hypothetical protein THF5H11_70083 [Vibrio jasicida]
MSIMLRLIKEITIHDNEIDSFKCCRCEEKFYNDNSSEIGNLLLNTVTKTYKVMCSNSCCFQQGDEVEITYNDSLCTNCLEEWHYCTLE